MPPKSCEQCRKRRISCVALTDSGCATCLRRRVDCSGPPCSSEFKRWTRVRKGQRMEELKAQLGVQREALPKPEPTSPPRLEVAPLHSATSRLFIFELAAALHQHLVLCARELGKSAAIPGTVFEPLAQQLHPENFQRKVSRPSPVSQPTSEVIIYRKAPILVESEASTVELAYACFAAFGARWSSHSAIIGSGASSEDLGTRREGACHALVDRAVAIAESSGLLQLRDPSIKRARVVNFLRQTINMAAPTHQSLPHIIRTIHHLRVADLADAQNPPSPATEARTVWALENPLADLAIQDARYWVSVDSDEPGMLSDEELLSSFGWTPALALKSVEHFEWLTSRPFIANEMQPDDLHRHSLNVGLYLDRSLVLLQHQGHLQPPLLIFTSFTSIANTIDIGADFAAAKLRQIQADKSLQRLGWADLFVGQTREDLMFLSHACSAIIGIARKSQAWAESDLYTATRERFERLLIRVLKSLLDSPTLREINAVHRLVDIAPLFATMDLTYDWLGLAVSATEPTSHLFDLGLTKGDLDCLDVALKRVSSVYAAGAIQSSLLKSRLSGLTARKTSQQPIDGEDSEIATKIIDSVITQLER